MDEVICAKLIKMGDEIKEHEISDDPTVEGLFDKAGEEFPDDCSVTRQGVEVNLDTRLYDGDKIFVGRKTKGNQDVFEVKLIRMGVADGIKLIASQGGQSIKQIIDQLPTAQKEQYYKADGSPAYEYRIGNSKVDENYVVPRPTDNQPVRIILSQKVKGN